MLNQELHREKMLEMLIAIYKDKFLASLLGFKGGTAVYLFHDLERFSVDLDFDLLDKSKEAEVHEKICQYATNFGQIKDEAIKFYGGLAVYSYAKFNQHIKVEISNRESISHYEIKDLLGTSIRVMTKEDMFANKLLALYERCAARDMFDVWFMFKHKWLYNKEIVLTRTNQKLVDFFEKCINQIEAFPASPLADLGHLVKQNQKDWVKDNLKNELLLKLKIHREAIKIQ
jgi:predicted nucleotidyltransferase component of viral defense system